MSFKLENFVAAPSMELLNLAKKTDLLNIADHYALTSVIPSPSNFYCWSSQGGSSVLVLW